MAEALVVVPTHDHAALLPLALRSAQEQTVGDLAIVVIGDGVGDDTRDALAPLLAGDRRITFLDLPKAGRTGEPHRDPVVRATDAPITTYLADDDLLLPDHVAVLGALLAEAELAAPFPAYVDAHGGLVVDPLGLADPRWVARQLGGDSLLSLTGVAHGTAAYRRLPYGWRATPPGAFTDQYMWQQWLAQPWCRVAMAPRPTTARFPTTVRTTMAPEQRHAELDRWAGRLATADGRASYVDDVMVAFRRSASDVRLAFLDADAAASAATTRSDELHLAQAALLQQLGAVTTERDTARADLASTRSTTAELGARLEAARLDGEAVLADRRTIAAERDALRRHLEVTATERAALAEHVAQVRAERDRWREQWWALAATRTVRLRDRLVRFRLVRVLLARRPPAR